jgi:HEAT repeat protein
MQLVVLLDGLTARQASLDDTADEVVDSICNTLGQITDWRTMDPLLEMVRDSDRIGRSSIISALSNAGWVDADKAHEWFGTADPVLRDLSVGHLGWQDSEALLAILQEPSHPSSKSAVDAIAFGFEQPNWQQRKCNALAHEDPAVRLAAASSILWDEPIMAESFLLRGLDDSDTAVACECADVLQYYPSRRVLLELTQRIHVASDELRGQMNKTVENVLFTFEQCLDDCNGEERRRFLDWAAPVRQLLRVIPEVPVDLGREAAFDSLQSRANRTSWTNDLAATVADPDGCWTPILDALRRLDLSSLSSSERVSVLRLLSTHEDAEVRAISAGLISESGDEGLMIALIHDSVLSVGRSAVYCSHDLPASREIAALAIASVTSGQASGRAAHEAIRTWANHVGRLHLEQLSVELLKLVNDDRESVRCEAIEQLAIRDDKVGLQACLRLLDEPPLITWSVHGTLLEAAHRLGLSVSPDTIASLRAAADHAWLQAILASWPD